MPLPMDERPVVGYDDALDRSRGHVVVAKDSMVRISSFDGQGDIIGHVVLSPREFDKAVAVVRDEVQGLQGLQGAT